MKKSIITGLVLSSFALICGLLLGIVNHFTKGVIESRNNSKVKAAIAEVCPNYDKNSDKLLTINSQGTSEAYLIKDKNGTKKYVCYKIVVLGYKADIVLLIGISKDLAVSGYSHISSQESKGNLPESVLKDEFGMIGESSIDSFDIIVGTTSTSNVVKKCFEIAFSRAKIDLN